MTVAGRKNVKVPTIAEIPKAVDPGVRDVLEGIIQTHDIREGRAAKGTNSRFVTIQDLINAGIIVDGKIV
jgi:hypothetical protein